MWIEIKKIESKVNWAKEQRMNKRETNKNQSEPNAYILMYLQVKWTSAFDVK